MLRIGIRALLPVLPAARRAGARFAGTAAPKGPKPSPTAGPGSSAERVATGTQESVDISNLLQLLSATQAARAHGSSLTQRSLGSNLSRAGVFGSLAHGIDVPPRTGTLVGRSVPVRSPDELPQAIARLNTLNKINRMPHTVRVQQFWERPGKKRLRLRIERKRRAFRSGIDRLFALVSEARRKGY